MGGFIVDKKPTHGGKRKGAGRKPASLPLRTKKLRASQKDWEEFLSFLGGDAEQDFCVLLVALRMYDEIHKEVRDDKNIR